MRFPRRRLHGLLLAGLLLLPRPGAASETPASAASSEEAPPPVVILANADLPESLSLARYYARARNIPESHIVALPLPPAENVTWDQFLNQLQNPLLARLIELGWIDGSVSPLTDALGRQRAVVYSHKIGDLVLMRGVPLRIHSDPDRLSREPVPGLPEPFRKNEGSVDGHLALLAVPGAPLVGFVPNPLYQGEATLRSRLPRESIVRVSRLDGPSESAVRQMIDGALQVERDGLLGRAYVDFAEFYPRGEQMLENISARLREISWPPVEHRAKPVFALSDRMEGVAVYFGWYEEDVTGPFKLPGFRLAPGAIAVHLHSFSAQTLRDPQKAWCGPLIARGASVTLGNVFEPYLETTHHLDVFFKHLSEGKTVSEAGYAALPILGWQAVLLGDPLYRPFRVPFTEAAERAARETVRYGQYAGVRLLETAPAAPAERAAARQLAERIQFRNPGLALALALAEDDHAAGRRRDALTQLEVTAHLATFPADEWTLVRQISLHMEAWGERVLGRRLREQLLAQPGLPEELANLWRNAPIPSRETAPALPTLPE